MRSDKRHFRSRKLSNQLQPSETPAQSRKLPTRLAGCVSDRTMPDSRLMIETIAVVAGPRQLQSAFPVCCSMETFDDQRLLLRSLLCPRSVGQRDRKNVVPAGVLKTSQRTVDRSKGHQRRFHVVTRGSKFPRGRVDRNVHRCRNAVQRDVVEIGIPLFLYNFRTHNIRRSGRGTRHWPDHASVTFQWIVLRFTTPACRQNEKCRNRDHAHRSFHTQIKPESVSEFLPPNTRHSAEWDQQPNVAATPV